MPNPMEFKLDIFAQVVRVELEVQGKKAAVQAVLQMHQQITTFYSEEIKGIKDHLFSELATVKETVDAVLVEVAS